MYRSTFQIIPIVISHFFEIKFPNFSCLFVPFSDIDECQNPGSCGLNALCQNTPGNYTCACPNGYGGNPYDGVNITIFFILAHHRSRNKRIFYMCLIILKNDCAVR